MADFGQERKSLNQQLAETREERDEEKRNYLEVQ